MNTSPHTSSHTAVISYRQIMALSLPIIFANVTIPIQGMIDVAIIGHLDSPAYLSAVGLATQWFALLLVSFNFLQYASSGLSAQATGNGDNGKLKRVLLRALLIAVVLGVGLIAVQWVTLRGGWWFFNPQGAVKTAFSDYFSVRIWGAPIELANYAFIGWFAGQGRPSAVFRQQLTISISNVVFNFLFVIGLGWGVVGVALGTLLANILGAVYAFMLVTKTLNRLGQPLLPIDWQRLLKTDELKKLMHLNRDIMIRTLVLTAAFTWITRLSAQQGELLLAANVILLQLLHIAAYSTDGIAVTTESLVGQAVGRQDRAGLRQVVWRTTWVSLVFAVLLAVVFFAMRPLYLNVMTDIAEVAELAKQYYWWAALLPVGGVLAYQFDGVMFGLTANTIIRNSMLWVAVLFFPVSYGLAQWLGNDGVWLSIYWFFALRGGILMYRYMRMDVFSGDTTP